MSRAVLTILALPIVAGLGALAAGCEGELGSGEPRDGGPIVPGLDAGPGADGGPIPTVDAGPGRDATVPPIDGGPGDPCAGITCGANASCDPASRTCVCNPGFTMMAGGCTAIPPGDPAGRTASEVCAQWTMGHLENEDDAWTEVPGDMCAPGTMTRAGIDDTLRRINMFRWMVGLDPVTDDPAQHPDDQACAVLMNANGALSHMPPASWTCYSAAGAAGAGRSNLALGVGSPGDAIDLYIDDNRVPSLGHRRWVLNGPLGRVGIGFAGRAQCLGVFDGSGSSSRSWTSWPNPGPVPTAALGAELWSFHVRGASLRSATVTVVRVGDGATLPITVSYPPDGFGPNTVAWDEMGWTASAGQRYRVTVDGFTGGPVTYEVAPTSCP